VRNGGAMTFKIFREELVHEVFDMVLNHIDNDDYSDIWKILDRMDIYELVALLPKEQREKWDSSIV